LKNGSRVIGIDFFGFEFTYIFIVIEKNQMKHFHKGEKVVSKLKSASCRDFIGANMLLGNILVGKWRHIEGNYQYERIRKLLSTKSGHLAL
jgi:hypothetical protein